MSTTTIIVAALVVLTLVALLALGIVLAITVRRKRTERLRTSFSEEYDRAVEKTGDRGEAERILEQRLERRRQLQIRDLSPPEGRRYAEEWGAVQTRFVDDPRGAVEEADALVTRVLRDRGYPTDDFEQQAADVSVDHATAVGGYRQAHAALLSTGRQAATDQLRLAMVHYRDLFEQLVGEPLEQAGRPGAGTDQPNGRAPTQEDASRHTVQKEAR